MESQAATRVGILFDIENILYTAINDGDLIGHQHDHVLRAATISLEQIARGFGSIAFRFGALSLPRVNTREAIADFGKRMETRRDKFKLAQMLVDVGYEISLVAHGEHAADHPLCRTGADLAENVDVIVVATGDAEEPFATLYRNLLMSGKRVHVASYQYVPRKVKYRTGVSYACIAPQVLHLLEGKTKSEDFIQEAVNRPATHAETEASEHEEMRKSVKAFVRGELERVDPTHLLWIRGVIGYIARTLRDGGSPHLKFWELADVVKVDSTWPDPKPSKKLIKTLVAALTKTDLFERSEVYSLNDKSKLLAD